MDDFKCVISKPSQDIICQLMAAHKEAGPHRYKNPIKYTEILNEFYRLEIIRRFKNSSKINQNITEWRKTNKESLSPLVANMIHAFSQREHIVDFMVEWCWTHDPRNANYGLPTRIPWIPWPRQIEFIEWFYTHYLTTYGDPQKKGGIIEKSRDAGASFLACFLGIFEWRWVDGFVGGFGSNKFDSVDKKDNPKCLFEKIRTIIQGLPPWWMPVGFEWRKHSKIANLINPEKNSYLTGEGGEHIGRGDRTTVYFNDEKAFFETPQAADDSLSQTTFSQFDISTPCGQNNFWEKRFSGKYDVFTFDWREDPRKDEEWYKHEVARLAPVTVAQEIDHDYNASIEGICIEAKWVNAAVDIKLEAKGVCAAGLDIGAGGTDPSALITRVGPVTTKVRQWDIENGVDLSHKTIDKCNQDGVSILQYDQNSVGHAVHSTLDRTERKMDFECFGIFGQGAVSDLEYEELGGAAKDIFVNCRAETWYIVARLFENTYEHVTGVREHKPEDMISIPNDAELKAQLSSPKMQPTNNGKRKIESKPEMKKRGVKSPNKADALILAYSPRDAGHKHLVDNFKSYEFVMDWGKHPDNCLNYGAICQRKDLTVNALCAVWHKSNGHLYVYAEMAAKSAVPGIIANFFTEKMKTKVFEVKKILGNSQMFAEDKKSTAKQINKQLYQFNKNFQKVKIKEPKKYDTFGSMAILNDLIKKQKFTVHKECKEVVRQLSNWRLEKGKVNEVGMKESILMIVSELRKVVDIKEILRNVEYWRRENFPKPRVDFMKKKR